MSRKLAVLSIWRPCLWSWAPIGVLNVCYSSLLIAWSSLIFPKIVSLLLHFWVSDILLQFHNGIYRPCTHRLAGWIPKNCHCRSKCHLFGMQAQIVFLKFVKQFTEEIEVFIHISVHDENVVDVYYHVSSYLGNKCLAQRLCKKQTWVYISHVQSRKLKMSILQQKSHTWLVGFVQPNLIVTCSKVEDAEYLRLFFGYLVHYFV